MLARVLQRLLLAVLLAALLVGLGMTGTLVTSSPEPLGLMFEPLCLLLLPGIVVALLLSGAHDFSADLVLQGALVFYAIVTYWQLGRWMRGAARVARGD